MASAAAIHVSLFRLEVPTNTARKLRTVSSLDQVVGAPPKAYPVEWPLIAAVVFAVASVTPPNPAGKPTAASAVILLRQKQTRASTRNRRPRRDSLAMRCLILVELLTVATFVVVIADEEYSKTHYYVPFVFSFGSQHTSKLVAREEIVALLAARTNCKNKIRQKLSISDLLSRTMPH